MQHSFINATFWKQRKNLVCHLCKIISCEILTWLVTVDAAGYSVVTRIPRGAANLDIRQYAPDGHKDDDIYLGNSVTSSSVFAQLNHAILQSIMSDRWLPPTVLHTLFL